MDVYSHRHNRSSPQLSKVLPQFKVELPRSSPMRKSTQRYLFPDQEQFLSPYLDNKGDCEEVHDVCSAYIWYWLPSNLSAWY
jgi:hypothetical protein